MSEPCKFEDKIIEMYADIKETAAIVRSINGDIIETKKKVDNHIEEGNDYRKKINELWAGVHFSKWIVGLILGGGLIFNLIRLWP